jgi:hypothetical protein
MDELKDVNNINGEGMVAEQAIGRQLAWTTLRDFFNDLHITSPTEKPERKTYE